VIVKASTLLLLCGLSLTGAAAADPFGAPPHGPDRWIFGPPGEGYALLRRVPRAAQNTAIPLPRPRPYVWETMGAAALRALNRAAPAPATASIPQPPPLAAAGLQNASTSHPTSAPLGATEQGADGESHERSAPAAGSKPVVFEPGQDNTQGNAQDNAQDNTQANAGAAMPVSVSDAGGGRIRIEAHDASLDQVLAALRDSHLIQYSAVDAPPRTITGIYTGTLPQVLSRILDGQNYFLHVTETGTELHAINTSAGTNASGGTNAALRSGIVGSAAIASEPPPTPPPTFSFTPPNPDGPQTRVTPSPAAKARARHPH